MIAVEHLVKQYGRFTAVDGVSLDVRPGEIHGFLGPNGAGKTTTLRMIAGLLKPTSGRVLVNGHDVAAEPELAKASLGFIPDRPFIYEKLTAGEFLRFHAGLYGLGGDGVMDPAPIIEESSAAQYFAAASILDDGNPENFDEAATAYRRALEIDPYLVPALINLANIHYSRDEIAEAQAL